MTKPTGPRRRTLAAAVAAAAVLLGTGCSNDRPQPYQLTVLFDEHTEAAVPPGVNREARVVSATPDGTLYVEIYDGGQHPRVFQVRSPAGSYQPAPPELTAEDIAAMTIDPVSGDAFALSYPEGRARIRRFHDGRVVQDFTPRNPEGGPFPPQRDVNGDEADLFYDASSGSLLYADGNLYHLNATAAATVAIPRPKPPGDGPAGGGGIAPDDYAVTYAVNARSGTVSVAVNYHDSKPDCRSRDTVYRVEGNGRMTRLAGGCVKGRDDLIEGGVSYMAADPASEDLLLWGPLSFHWLSKGKLTSIYDLPFGPVRGVAFDGAGHAYVGKGGQVVKITFRR